jgi:hypothetical protein
MFRLCDFGIEEPEVSDAARLPEAKDYGSPLALGRAEVKVIERKPDRCNMYRSCLWSGGAVPNIDGPLLKLDALRNELREALIRQRNSALAASVQAHLD